MLKAREAMKAARRHTIRLQQQMANARTRRSKSIKKMSKAEVERNLMTPVQERAFHQLFAMEEYIDELLEKMRQCPAKKEDMCTLMSDPRVVRILSEMSITEQMLAYLVKDSLIAGGAPNMNDHPMSEHIASSSSSTESTTDEATTTTTNGE